MKTPKVVVAARGMTTGQACAEGRSVTEVLAEASEHLVVAMTAGTPVVVFSASYDLILIEAGLVRHGLPTMYSRPGRELGPIADPLVLDRTADRYHRDKRRLGDLCEIHGIRVSEALHAAEVDVAATLGVLEVLITTHLQLPEFSPDELVALRARAHRTWAEPFDEQLAYRDSSCTSAQITRPLSDSPTH